MKPLITRVFNAGNSQAVCIPDELRLETERVTIVRNERGDLVLHPLPAAGAKRGTALLEALRGVAGADGAFVAALESEQHASHPMQWRKPM